MPTVQQELPFALLDMHGKSVLTVREVAERLHCTRQHVSDLIAADELAAVNIGKGQSRMAARIPVESFRDSVLRSMTCEFAVSPIRHMPTQSLIRWHQELTKHLKSKGVRV